MTVSPTDAVMEGRVPPPPVVGICQTLAPIVSVSPPGGTFGGVGLVGGGGGGG